MCGFVSVRLKSATGMYTERNLTVQISKQTFAKQPLEIYVEWLHLERKFPSSPSRQYFEPNLPFFCSCPHLFRKTRISWFFLLLPSSQWKWWFHFFFLLKAAILKSCHSFFVVLVFTSCLTSICLCPDANLILTVLRKKFDRKFNFTSEILVKLPAVAEVLILE